MTTQQKRKSLGLTQSGLGVVMKVDGRTVRRWENNNSIPPSMDMLLDMIIKYGVTV